MTEREHTPPHPPGTPGDGGDEHLYHYRDAGITEQRGPLPAWLVLVAVGLVAWGAYYLVRYWTPPAP